MNIYTNNLISKTKKVVPYSFSPGQDNKTLSKTYEQIFTGYLQIHNFWIYESTRQQRYGSALLDYEKIQTTTFVIIEFYHTLKYYLKYNYFIDPERQEFKGDYLQFLWQKNLEVSS